MYFKKYLNNIINVIIPFMSLIKCNKSNKYSECFYEDTFNYVSCILYLNKNNPQVSSCINISGIDNIYKNDFNFIIPKKDNCSISNNEKIYKYIMDPFFESAQCFLDIKHKNHGNSLFNCNRLNTFVSFKSGFS
jgi:hypothetical protein